MSQKSFLKLYKSLLTYVRVSVTTGYANHASTKTDYISKNLTANIYLTNFRKCFLPSFLMLWI